MFKIFLLGTPAITLDDQLVRVQRRNQRGLLAYLACQTDLTARSELLQLFWPERTESDGRRQLREALSKLKAQLRDKSIWITYHDRVGLDPSQVYVDVRDFRETLAQNWRVMQQLPTRGALPEPVYQEISRAAGLWHSARFMAGASLPSTYDFDRWLTSCSQDLEGSRQRLLERLAYHLAAGGDLEGAIYWLQQALEYDDLDEGMHYQVLSWLNSLGRGSEALNYCAYLTDHFEKEIGEAPSGDLAGLIKKIRSEASAPPKKAQATWQTSFDPSIPFVGRGPLLRELTFAYQLGGSVVITGEAGAGKSRLVHQFYKSLQPAPRLLLARARASESSLPFQPLIDVLRENILEEEWRQLNPVWLGVLARLLPELSALRPSFLSGGPDGTGEAALIFEAIRQLLLQLGGAGRVLFFLDNAQWADEATLAALEYLQEHQFFVERGLLILAVRPEEHNLRLEEFLHRPTIRTRLVRQNVGPLGAAEITAVARYLLGQDPPAGLVERLAYDTGGNALFLIETLQAWLAASTPQNRFQAVESLPLARSIQYLLRERIRAYPARSREALASAAVIGHEFTAEALEMVTGINPPALVNILEELERGHLISPDPRSLDSGGYVFVHAMLRKVLLADLSPARRRLLHLRATEAAGKISKSHS